jgi:hypothetical protein
MVHPHRVVRFGLVERHTVKHEISDRLQAEVEPGSRHGIAYLAVDGVRLIPSLAASRQPCWERLALPGHGQPDPVK